MGFIETFVRNDPKGQWIICERERLTNAIASREGEAGYPVTVVWLPGRRAASGRPQGRP